MTERYLGHCLCGLVKFEARGVPKWVVWCHCESCRRHSGAPGNVFVSFSDTEVSVTEGAITTFESSPGVNRGFCARCGSTLTCTSPRLPGETHYYIGSFDRAAELKPKGAFFAGERLPWLHPQDE
jgi:hypothetical protein